MSRLAAAGAIVIIASAVAGCAPAGTPGKSATTSAAAPSPLQAIQLAAMTEGTVNSYTANMSVQASISGTSDAFSLAGTFSDQVHPLVVEATLGLNATGQSFPGRLSEIITPSSLYMKLPVLSQALHTTKPWLEISFSALSKASGVNFSSLTSWQQTSSPLAESELFSRAQSVREVGTGTVDGVPVTEYAGTVSMSKALAELPASLRASLGQDLEKAGISSMRFNVWVDGQHLIRKMLITESGGMLTEQISMTITSINQPVNIQLPSASQTATLPASVLNGI